MIVRADLAALRESRWYEYLVRFGLGGVATVGAGLVADGFGPMVGGMRFLPSSLRAPR
jgi:hypothetical protein